MSRGHGRVQLQVLEFLLRVDEDAKSRGEHDAYVGVLDIAGESASRSRIESVRRAVKSLADEGLIVLSTEDGQRATRAGSIGAIHQSRGARARLATPADRLDRAATNEMSA